MNRVVRSILDGGRWLWERVSAGVAVVLILAALAIGYRLGTPASEREAGGVGEVGHDHAHEGGTEGPDLYTCPMHPSVRLPDADAKCPICHMDLIPVGKDMPETVGERRLVLSEAAARASRVETASVERFFPTAEVRLYGKVTYDETSVARLTAYFPGRIERLFVHYAGVPVARGDHLAEIYSPELLAAFEELRQAARAAREAGDAGGIVRRTTRDTLFAAREKLRLFGITSSQIEAVEDGSYNSDRLTIYAPIGGIVTRLAVREGDYVRTGEEMATVADLSRLWLDMEAYESQLPMLRWGLPVTFTVEAHPGERFEGRISFIEPTVDDRTRTAAVRVAVDNRDGRLKPGMFASAVARVRVGEGGAVMDDGLAGRMVCPMHPTEVYDGPGTCAICGMDLVTPESLGVTGEPARAKPPLVVPRSAVLFTGTRSVVYVAVAGAETPTYEGREVVLGPRAGGFYVVREGLREGEEVVVNGAFRIDSAMQIAAKPSMMMPEGGPGGAGGHAGHAHAPAGERAPEPAADAGDAFVRGLTPVYAAYFDAQTALAADDLVGFNRAARELRAALDAAGEVGLAGGAIGTWRRAAGQLRVEGEVTEIDAARTRFGVMSEGVLPLERRFGHAGGETWHVAHCPMALANKGADWLQRGEEIVNPYMGRAMLRCGSIEGAFPALGVKGGSEAPRGAHGEGDHE